MIQFEELGFAVLICGSCDEFYGVSLFIGAFLCAEVCALRFFSEAFVVGNLAVRVCLAHRWKIVIYGLRCAFHGRCGG